RSAPRAADHGPTPDEDGTGRAGEARREAEGDGVRGSGQIRGSDTERHDGVPEPGAVEVERDAVGMGDVCDLARVGGGEWLTHRVRVRVLDRDEPADRLMRVGRIPEGRF